MAEYDVISIGLQSHIGSTDGDMYMPDEQDERPTKPDKTAVTEEAKRRATIYRELITHQDPKATFILAIVSGVAVIGTPVATLLDPTLESVLFMTLAAAAYAAAVVLAIFTLIPRTGSMKPYKDRETMYKAILHALQYPNVRMDEAVVEAFNLHNLFLRKTRWVRWGYIALVVGLGCTVVSVAVSNL